MKTKEINGMYMEQRFLFVVKGGIRESGAGSKR